MREELRSLRTLLEQQVAALAWNDFTRREPFKARALADLARSVWMRRWRCSSSPSCRRVSSDQMQRMPYALLARRSRPARRR